MQTNSFPEISAGDLDAARRFLLPDESRDAARPTRGRRSAPRRDVTFHHGIARARSRPADHREG